VRADAVAQDGRTLPVLYCGIDLSTTLLPCLSVMCLTVCFSFLFRAARRLYGMEDPGGGGGDDDRVWIVLESVLVFQCLLVPGEMFADKGGDKVVAVIVTFLHAQRERNIARATGCLQVLRVQLLGQEFVRRALIDQ